MAGRTTPAERQRLCRKRRREGVLVLRVVGKPDLVSAFIKRGWLSADAAQDARVVAEAVEVLLDCWVRGNEPAQPDLWSDLIYAFLPHMGRTGHSDDSGSEAFGPDGGEADAL